MNKGISIVELAARIQIIEDGKKDLVVPSTRMAMKDGKTLMIGDNGNSSEYTVSQLAHEQIGARLKIPRDYYKRMQEEAPALLDQNVNNWLHRIPERRLVRTVDGNVRAILSDRYKRKENITVLTEALPFMLNPENKLEIMSSNLSEKQMFVKVVSDLLVGEVRVGQVVKGGFSLRNSEVGCGAFDLSLFVLTLSCMNGMMREHSMKEYHVGKRIEVNENEESSSPIYSAETIAADEHAFKLKVRDTLKHALNRQKFNEELAKFRAAAENPLNPRMITDTIEDVTKRYSMTQNEGKDILARLLESKDFTQWGLSSAVTNLAGELDDYDRSTELEKIGGQIIDLRPADWRIITRLAA